MDDYSVFVHEELALTKLKLGHYKTAVKQFIQSLAANPFNRGDYQEHHESETVEIKVVGTVAVVFQVDHAVKRVLILEICPADR